MISVIQNFDESILITLAELRNPHLNQIMIDVTALGSASVLTALTLIIISFFAIKRNLSAVVQLALAGIGAAFLPALLKTLFERPRPSIVDAVVVVSSSSLPSGHTFGATSIYLTLAMLAHSTQHIPAHRKTLLGFAIAIIALVAFSRMYLGVHYPSDVLLGFLLGCLWCWLSARLAQQTANFKS